MKDNLKDDEKYYISKISKHEGLHQYFFEVRNGLHKLFIKRIVPNKKFNINTEVGYTQALLLAGDVIPEVG